MSKLKLDRVIGFLAFTISLAFLSYCMSDLTTTEDAAFILVGAAIAAGSFGLYLTMRPAPKQ